MPIQSQSEITQRELVEFDQAKEMFDKQASLQLELKRLEIEHLKIESRFNSWFSIPIRIIKLPLYVLLGGAYIVHAVRKTEPPQGFYDLLK